MSPPPPPPPGSPHLLDLSPSDHLPEHDTLEPSRTTTGTITTAAPLDITVNATTAAVPSIPIPAVQSRNPFLQAQAQTQTAFSGRPRPPPPPPPPPPPQPQPRPLQPDHDVINDQLQHSSAKPSDTDQDYRRPDRSTYQELPDTPGHTDHDPFRLEPATRYGEGEGGEEEEEEEVLPIATADAPLQVDHDAGNSSEPFDLEKLRNAYKRSGSWIPHGAKTKFVQRDIHVVRRQPQDRVLQALAAAPRLNLATASPVAPSVGTATAASPRDKSDIASPPQPSSTASATTVLAAVAATAAAASASADNNNNPASAHAHTHAHTHAHSHIHGHNEGDPSDSGSGSTISSESEMEEEESWISAFCNVVGHEYFAEVSEDFIEDDFNLTGLGAVVPKYKEALEMILDVEPDEDSDSLASASESLSEDPSYRRRTSHNRSASDYSVIEASAELLYGLIHQRFITSRQGIQVMYEKYLANHFGFCPRVNCTNARVLPCGYSDTPGQETVKLFCPSCCDIYVPPNSRFQSVDGAYFGTTFPSLFLMTFPELDISGNGKKEITGSNSLNSAGGKKGTINPHPVINGVPANNITPGLGKGKRYEMRIYGFRVNERARSGPRMGWLRDRPEDLMALDETSRADMYEDGDESGISEGSSLEDAEEESGLEDEQEEEMQGIDNQPSVSSSRKGKGAARGVR